VKQRISLINYLTIIITRNAKLFFFAFSLCIFVLKILASLRPSAFALNAFTFAFSAADSLTFAMQLAQYAKYARGGYTGASRCTCAISAD
jgi:hypothetical protein